MIQMQTTECVEKVYRAERREVTCLERFNSDSAGERKQKKHKGSTATARLKRQAEGGGGGGEGGHAGDPALRESLFTNVLLGSIKDFEGSYLYY